jgi:hypothetical protein
MVKGIVLLGVQVLLAVVGLYLFLGPLARFSDVYGYWRMLFGVVYLGMMVVVWAVFGDR